MIDLLISFICHGSPPDVRYEEFHPEIVFETVTAACEFMRMFINRSQDFMKASYNSRLDFIFAKIGFTILQQLFRAMRALTALRVNSKMPSTPSTLALYRCHGSPPDVGYEEFHPESYLKL